MTYVDSTTTTGPARQRTAAQLPLRGRVTLRLLEEVVRRVAVDVVLPDGRRIAGAPTSGQASGPRAALCVHDIAFLERLGREPKLAVGEGYVAGEWGPAEGRDLAEVLTPFAERLTTLLPPPLLRLRRLVDRPLPASERGTIAGARRNVAAHYDLSNDLFAAFLDPTMTYSSALFDGTAPWTEQSLVEAQVRKIDAVLDLAGVGPGTRLLEIGTGWGSLAMAAARRGARVTTVTLSREQAALAAERVTLAGLGDRVDIRVEDYREVRGTYDAVASVEMIEAVGEGYWAEFFRVLDARLARGGRVALQSILMSHDRLHATRHSYGWIQKHIFPGGLIPSLEAIDAVTRTHTSMRVGTVHRFGPHYAETLRRWRRRFTEEWDRIAPLGFDETFRRTWEFYLAYCEAGFAAGYLDVARLQLVREEAA
jgi:cyclopropane-fatty-acyl-phospholipid synthase